MTSSRAERPRSHRAWLLAAGLFAGAACAASAQPATHDHGDATVQCRSGGDPDSLGCHILADQDVGRLGTQPLYWQVDRFPSEAAAASAAGPNSTLVRVYGGVWLMTLGPAGQAPDGGERIASAGPLPLSPGVRYKAQYMSASFRPGMRSRPHLHPGPEAWVVLEGAQCLETPEGAAVVAAGESGVVKGGIPMMLFSHGDAPRRSLVLILHDAAQPATNFATEWRPKGLCG